MFIIFYTNDDDDDYNAYLASLSEPRHRGFSFLFFSLFLKEKQLKLFAIKKPTENKNES